MYFNILYLVVPFYCTLDILYNPNARTCTCILVLVDPFTSLPVFAMQQEMTDRRYQENLAHIRHKAMEMAGGGGSAGSSLASTGTSGTLSAQLAAAFDGAGANAAPARDREQRGAASSPGRRSAEPELPPDHSLRKSSHTSTCYLQYSLHGQFESHFIRLNTLHSCISSY